LLGNLLNLIFYKDSKLRMFVCLAICHERHHGALRHCGLRLTISYMLHGGLVICNYAKFINWHVGRALNILF
jgi:hypothetical protein